MKTVLRAFGLLLCGLVMASASPRFADVPVMTAHYINVGQANATLLVFPCGTMLIDAGAEDDKYADRLIEYLDKNLPVRNGEKVIDVMIVTHSHKDHNSVLKRILEEFEVKRYVDNGHVSGSGKSGAKAVRKAIQDRSIDTKLTEVKDTDITSLKSKHGFWSKQIDPFKCSACNPKIRIMSASLDEEPQGWSNEDFDNENNHSLVIRVDFGESSFLFPGDLEEAGIETMLDYYKNDKDEVDVDVWEVDHHGASNGTTPEFVKALSPAIAIISCGNMEYGRATTNRWDAFGYGHPRADTVELLEGVDGVQATRMDAIDVSVATKPRRFHTMRVTKSIYSTAWDGTIVVKGFLDRDPVVEKMLHEASPNPD